jgi:pimeloyl-ACP methyl ester carboxylesterase
VFHADLAACNNYHPGGQVVAVPTLMIVGDADQMTPARRGLELAENLPDARVVRLAGCGHSMLSEAPNEVLDALITNV